MTWERPGRDSASTRRFAVESVPRTEAAGNFTRGARRRAARFALCGLIGLGLFGGAVPPSGNAQAWSVRGDRDALALHHGQYVLNRAFGDMDDSVFVLTQPDAAAPRAVTVAELADALLRYDVVFFGELHGHPGVHLQQMRLLRALYERDPRIVLSLEQFERDTQPVLDDYLAGRIGERTLIDKGRAWDNYPTSYRPLVTFARQHDLPVIAAEAPTWTIVCIGQQGADILHEFTPEERGWVARDLHMDSGKYREKFQQFESGSATHGGGGSNSPEAQAKSERSFTAQVARDDTMAESIFLARQKYPGRRILHLNGTFHSAAFLGTVERLRLRDPTLRIAVIEPVEVEDPKAPAFAQQQRRDGTALLLLYPSPPEFAEGEDPSDFIRSIMAKRKANPCKYELPSAGAGPGPAADGPPVIHHDLSAHLDPNEHRIEVQDEMTIPAVLVTEQLRLSLDAGLAPTHAGPGPRLRRMQQRATAGEAGMDRTDDELQPSIPVNLYRVEGATPGRDLHLEFHYQGIIDNPVTAPAAQSGRGFSESPGLIETRGVYLAGSSHWVMEIPETLITYRLQTDLPPGWKSVSEGVRDTAAAQPIGRGRVHETWRVDTPTQQVHLIAAVFSEFERAAGPVKAYAFLRTPDEALAARYLDATAQYLQMYDALLGPYPYGKFALVENFWETGYGMPSFTLLGEQIIRFPFILTSSYPHELLHNWWGNGVFVDVRGGNWCEGLTAYLADHLMQEQRGQGSADRRDILQRVTDYVTPQNDFPLREFRARHDAATEAVGYGKGAMVWNMLRERVGDARFVASLRRFYRDNRFKPASFSDIRRSFEATTGENLEAFFHQWIDAAGTPELALSDATRSGHRVTLRLTQVQPGRPLALDVPIAIQTARGVEMRRIALSQTQAATSASFDLDAPATRIDVDPEFQVYRRLSPLETTPSLSRAFGAEHVLIVVAAAERDGVYAPLLKAWVHGGVEVASDRDLAKLPDDRPVWIMGRSNRFLADVDAALRPHQASIRDGVLRIEDASYAADKSIVATARNPTNPTAVLIFLSAPSAAAAAALARKLPHYGKYSWLIFGGDAADNEGKGEWAPLDSPLRHVFDPGAAVTPLPGRKALVDATFLQGLSALRVGSP